MVARSEREAHHSADNRISRCRATTPQFPIAVTASYALKRIPISYDSTGCASQLVYEPDIAALKVPFPERLAKAHLRSLVAAVESKGMFPNRTVLVCVSIVTMLGTSQGPRHPLTVN
jgi:hypothetical protein